jgi:hypothetical protein
MRRPSVDHGLQRSCVPARGLLAGRRDQAVRLRILVPCGRPARAYRLTSARDVTMLICRPVSSRSEPQKIQRWIEQMSSRREQLQHDPQAAETIERCVEQAKEWLAAR